MASALPSLSDQVVRLRIIAFLLFAGYGWILLHGATGMSDVALTGAFLLLSIAVSFFIPHRRFCNWLWLVGALFLAIIHGVNWLTSQKGIGLFLEHASQIGLPILLFFIARSKPDAMIAKTALVFIAMTFVFHGLFAIGIPSSFAWLNHATPDHFLFMTKETLGIDSDGVARQVLLAAGVLDLVAAAAIFSSRFRKAGLVYMLIWGFLTALARPVAYVELDTLGEDLMRWFPEFLIRTPHWGIPLALLGWPSLSCCSPKNPKS
jgi:hypothetical protein